MTTPPPSDIAPRTAMEQLALSVAGEIVRPDDGSFDSIRRNINNAAIDHMPHLIVRPVRVEDVAAAVTYAASEGLSVSTRGGGHHVAGHGVAAEGVMIDFSLMREVRVDPDRRIAVAQAGATWADFDAATQAHGLAAPGGVVSTTGVAGLTLGGGIGSLRGLHGLSADNLRSVTMVTADGAVVRAGAEENPHLLWAVRGAASNFGAVVEMEFQLHPVGPVVVGGIEYPLSEAVPVVANFRRQAETLPDEFSAEFLFHRDKAGRGSTVTLAPHYFGTIETAGSTLESLRSFGSPLDDVRDGSYLESQTQLDIASQFGRRHFWRTLSLVGLSDQLVGIIRDHVAAAPSWRDQVLVEHLHGEIHRVPASHGATWFRYAQFNVMIMGQWDDAADDEANIAWANDLYEAMEPFAARYSYTNYLVDLGADEVRKAFGDTNYRRLREIKREFDPGNVFRANHNIVP